MRNIFLANFCTSSLRLVNLSLKASCWSLVSLCQGVEESLEVEVGDGERVVILDGEVDGVLLLVLR